MITKKQVDHYWYYYKWHFFAFIAILLAIIYTFYSCATTLSPDIAVMYVGTVPITTEMSDKFALDYSDIILDTDNNGQNVIIMNKAYLSSGTSPESENGYKAKITADLITKTSKLYIIAEELLYFFEDQHMFKLQDGGSKLVPMRDDACAALGLYGGKYYLGIIDDSENIKQEKQFENAQILLEQLK